jgi:hypothetical protein
VVSHHLDGFLRAAVAGLLHPAADPGFTAFPAFGPRARATPEGGPCSGACRAFPAMRFTPFEEFPSSAAVPPHGGPCPPAVTVPPGPAGAEATTSSGIPPPEGDGAFRARRRSEERGAHGHGTSDPTR